jgi:hypothetical protein
MESNRTLNSPAFQFIYEDMLSLNLGLTLVAFLFLFNPRPVTSLLFRMDVAISRYLHILNTAEVPKDYFTSGYFAFFLPALGLALCFWILLRLFSRQQISREIPNTLGGIVALAASPIYWLLASYVAGLRYGWNPFRAIQVYELIAILICLSISLRWQRTPLWISILVVLLHYAFWFQQFGTYHVLRGNAGPIVLLPIVGLASALAWISYSAQFSPASGPNEPNTRSTGSAI